MALGFATALRTARLDAINTFAGNGALIRLYSGTRPATGGAVTTLLGELVCNTPFATVSGSTLTVNAIAPDSAADASGSFTWFRVVKSDGTTFVMDGTAATSGGDLNFNSTGTTSGSTAISINSFVINEANA